MAIATTITLEVYSKATDVPRSCLIWIHTTNQSAAQKIMKKRCLYRYLVLSIGKNKRTLKANMKLPSKFGVKEYVRI